MKGAIFMELRVLRYFLAIAREQGITRAAEALHITQPTLSRQIAELEEELGVQLFDRSGRRIQLTDEGILFRRRAMEILDLVNRTREEMTQQDELIEGTVSIGCGVLRAFQDLAQIIARFREIHSHVHFEIYTGNADDVQQRIDQGLLDLALFIEPVASEPYADPARLALRPLSPELSDTALLAWRRQQPYPRAVTKFIEFAQQEIPKITEA